MLQKYLLTLRCIVPGAVCGAGGSEVHGMLFSLFKEIDASYADTLHGAVDKPFALGACAGKWSSEGKFSISQIGKKYTIAVSCLTPELINILNKIAVLWPGREIKLGSAIFTGEKVIQLYPDNVMYQDILTGPLLHREFTLYFSTPTSFRSQDAQYLFPVPEKVFQNLLHRWNTFSPIQLPGEIDFSSILVKKYDLRTKMEHFKQYMISGFTGQCTYFLPDELDDLFLLYVSALARFAKFSGVGYKATMGLGSARLVKNKH